MNSGDLIHTVVFKQPTSSLNNEGGEEKTFADATITTRAAVSKFNQFRRTEAEAAGLIGSFDFTIRYSVDRSAIDKDWLISYKGNDYTIHQIELIDQKEQFIRFTAKAKE